MDQRLGPSRWAPWAAAAAVSVLVGVFAYNAGLHEATGGSTEFGRRSGVWFPFGLLFVCFWVFALARGGCWGGGWRYRGRYGYDDPAHWDDWHRRAHEHMKNADDPHR